jgi:N-dimethylarginine dimethylaminohydrolase
VILAGHGFRTEPAAHAEAQEVQGRPVVSLKLVDPCFYHLDTALAALDDRHVVLDTEATAMAEKVRAAGYLPVPVELSELKRGGGSVKCAVAELRH